VSIVGGTCAFVLLCVTLASLWRMWKQIYALRAIQKALAKRKVQPPFYQYSDLRLGTKEFHSDHKLGHGSFGVVYKAILADGTLFAVKTLFDHKRLQNSLDDFLNEVVLITGIKHRNLVQLKGCCINDKERMLVYEYVEKGNLAEALWGSKAHGDLNWGQRFNICIGVARGLAYLHEELQPSIIHRDIKAANILLDKNCNPKIADFGLARHFDDEGTRVDQTDIAGTL
jgi:serine/threonine protein kinase